MNTTTSRRTVIIGNYTFDELLSSNYGRAILGVVFLWAFAAMPVVWNELGPTTKLGTQVTALLLLGTVILFKGYRSFGSRAGICFALLFLWYPLFCYISIQWSGEMTPEKLALYPVDLRSVLLGVLMYMFGYVAGRRMPTFVVVLGFIALGAYIIYRSDVYLDELTYWEFYRDHGYYINYQYVGDAFAICSLVLLSRIRRRTLAVAVFLASIGLLFVVPSRSSLIIGGAALIIAVAGVVPFRGLVARLGVTVGLLVSYFGTSHLFGLLDGTRLSRLFGDETDESVLGRARAHDAGMEAIYSNPLFGKFGFQIEAFGDDGLYMHSALDLWAQSGVLPFLAFLIGMLLIFWRIMKMLLHHTDLVFRSLPLFFFAVASWVLARHPWAYQLFFIVGFVLANTVSRTRREIRRKGA